MAYRVKAVALTYPNRQGENAFMDYQVQEALVTFRQGFGRLFLAALPS